VLYLHARALLAVGRTQEALEAYGKALHAFPAHGYETRPFDAAIAEARAAAPTSPSVMALAAAHSVRAGRLDAARDAAEKALAAYGVLAPERLRDLARWLRNARPTQALQ